MTAWFVKAMDFLGPSERQGEFAYVATNSIVQGESASKLFEKSSSLNWKIKFAYQPFPWESEAPGKASVHCVIVGYTLSDIVKPKLFEQNSDFPIMPKVISPYLLPGPPNIAVPESSKILSSILKEVAAGSTPLDWGKFIVSSEEYRSYREDKILKKYLRPYVGGHELIQGEERWCLWLEDTSTLSNDIGKSSVLKHRVDAVEEKRLSSNRVATRKAAETPYLFGEIRQPFADYLAIPQTFSEKRHYATVAYLPQKNNC